MSTTNKHTYRLPENTLLEIQKFADAVKKFKDGKISPAVFRAYRVPNGIYEQRKNGTYMVRIRVPAGKIYLHQLSKICELSKIYGSGTIHITDREDIQLHDVLIENTPFIMEELYKVGLTPKGGGGNTVRNITACPYAGICPKELFDVSPYAIATTEYMITQETSYNLPRKYKIAFSGCNEDCAFCEVNDLGFVAINDVEKRSFRIYVGGGMGAHSRVGHILLDELSASEVIKVAEAVKRLFDRFGNKHNKHKARLRFVFENMSAEEFKEHFTNELRKINNEGIPCVDTGIATNDKTTNCAQADLKEFLTEINGIKILQQKQPNYYAIHFTVPLGVIKADEMLSFINFCKNYQLEEVRTAQSQHILIPYVHKDILEQFTKELADSFREERLFRNILACPGASTCRLGLCMSRNLAKNIVEKFKEHDVDTHLKHNITIKINGCPNACGQHPIGNIGLYGAARRVDGRLVPTYNILLGGKTGKGSSAFGRFVGAVPVKNIPYVLIDLLKDFEAKRNMFNSFLEYSHANEADYFKRLISRYEDIPNYEEDASFYKDAGSNEDFSLAGRGAGECGAGVFEVITEDIALAKKHLKDAEKIADTSLFSALLATVRALLIVRGIDTANIDEIFFAFEKFFIDTGLVPEKFRELIVRGRSYQQGWQSALAGKERDVSELLERVEYLFSKLDASLNFNVSEATKTDANKSDAAKSSKSTLLDLRGVACPMNFVKAKIKLEELEANSVLTIFLDDGEPIKNVPESLRNEGQEILEISRMQDGYYKVSVKKIK